MQVFDRNFESLELYKRLKFDCEVMAMLYTKYCISKNKKIISKIIETLYDSEKQEREAIKLLINELRL